VLLDLFEAGNSKLEHAVGDVDTNKIMLDKEDSSEVSISKHTKRQKLVGKASIDVG
jgi:hypothetical protein